MPSLRHSGDRGESCIECVLDWPCGSQVYGFGLSLRPLCISVCLVLRIPYTLFSSTTSLKLGDSSCCVKASISMLPGTKLAPCSLVCVLWRCARAQPQPTAIDYLNQVVLMELPKSASVASHRLPRASSPRETAFLPWSHPSRASFYTPRTGPLPAAHGRVEEVHRSSTRSPRCPPSQ